MQTVFWLENLKGKDNLEDPDVDWDNIRMNFREIEWEVVD
jgi:hypothetical protein